MDQTAIKKMRAELGMRAAMRAAHDNPDAAKAAKAIQEIPVRKIYDQALHIENFILPKTEQLRGKDSIDYQFFREVFQSLLWAIVVLDRFDRVVRSDASHKLELEVWRDRVALLERELQKYITMEDLLMSDSVDRIAEVIKKRAENLLKK
jgi:hypothetical protein